MKRTHALLVLAVVAAGMGCKQTTYDNPVLPGDHPDLNIYAEGKDFYLAGSNFAMFPAIEILHSTDLLHWERVSRVVNANAPVMADQLKPGAGTWGAFIVKVPKGASLMPRGGYRIYFAINASQYYASAPSLKGPWSEPVKVASVDVSPAEGQPAIDRGNGSDNSVFIDTDGTTYMVTKNGVGKWGADKPSNDWGMNRLVAIDPGTGQLIASKMVNLDFVNWYSDKGGDGPPSERDYSAWAEGPTMTKRGDWYYYFVQTHTACSGKEDVWASKKLAGSVEADWHWLGYVMGPGDPYNGTQHSTAPFQLADGTWWAFAHSYDCTDNQGTAASHGAWLGLGREGLLHQVTWVDAQVDGLTIPVPHFTTETRNLPAPALEVSATPFLLPVNDDFSAPTLGTAWTTYARMGNNISVAHNKLQLAPDEATPTVWALQKEALRSTASVAKLEFAPSADGKAAGICLRNGFWSDDQILSGPTWIEGEGKLVGIFDVQVARTKVGGKDVIRFAYRTRNPVPIASYPDPKPGSYQALQDAVVVEYTAPAPAQRNVWLKLARSNHQATGWFSTDRLTWTQVGQAIDIKELDANYGMSNAWVGNQVGMFATGQSAAFDLFTYRDGFSAIPAVATDQQYGTAIFASSAKGDVLSDLGDDDWALYGSVDLGSGGVKSRKVLIDASSVGGAEVELWAGPAVAGGSRIATCKVKDTKGWETFGVTTCPLAGAVSGTHDVYLRVVGQPGSDLLRIASLRFAP
jgi:beta-xylosidase